MAKESYIPGETETYDEAAVAPKITKYAVRMQLGGPRGPYVKPGDSTVEIDGRTWIVRGEANTTVVEKIVAWYTLYLGDVGGREPIEVVTEDENATDEEGTGY